MSLTKTHWTDESITYDGSQLRPHWILERFGIADDAIVAFLGPCDVDFGHMIDVEDRLASSRIASKYMLHFIIEHFDSGLDVAVLRQRLLMARMAQCLNRRMGALVVRRDGSDLYDGDRKLTVSIATASPVSMLIHAGINVISEGTPVPTRGLADYDIDPREFGQEMLLAYAGEIASARHARCKARPAGGL